jgi:hypothetical protein
LNHFVGAQQQRLGDREPKRLGHLDIDHRFQLRRLLYGEISGRSTFEDLVSRPRSVYRNFTDAPLNFSRYIAVAR